MLYEKLDYIIAIVEERNLTKAAKKLDISQPTLTYYLNRLEADLGTKLFDRTQTPIAITAAGQYYVDKMRQIALSEQTLRSDIKFLSHPSKTLVVGTGQVRGNIWSPILLPYFSKLYPDVNVQIILKSEQALYEMLQQQKADLVIGVYPTASEAFMVEPLMQEKILLAASKVYGIIPSEEREKYSYQNPYIADPESIKGLPMIIPGLDNGLYQSCDATIKEYGLNPSRLISIGNMSTGLDLAAEGLGVQLLSQLALNGKSKDFLDSLDFFVLEKMPAYRRCVAVYNPQSVKIDLLKDFIGLIKTHVTKE